MNSVNLYVVVPCYNEEAVLPETSKRMLELFASMKNDGLINDKSRIVFVDDGSRDKTWSIIDALSKEHTEIAGVKLAGNAGQFCLYQRFFPQKGEDAVAGTSF